MQEVKRQLTNDEIEDLLSVIQIDKKIPFDIAMAVCENQREKITTQLKNIEIYPSLINSLKDKIEYHYLSSLVQAGDMIGCLAASSIGEQNTQQTLNSFHSAGIMKANLTTGVVRLKELLNASQNIKNPSNCIHLLENNIDLYTVMKIAESNFKFYNLESCIEKFDIKFKRELTKYEKKYYNFFNTFYNKHKHGLWSVRLYFKSDVLYRIQKSLEFISNTILSNYQDLYCVFFPDNKCIIDLWFDEDISNPEDYLQNLQTNSTVKKQEEDIEERKIDIINFIDIPSSDDEDLDHDLEMEIINANLGDNTELYENCEGNTINNNNKMYFYLKNVVVPSILNIKISGIEGINKCFYTEGKGGKWYIETEGSNFKELLYHPLVDHTRVYSMNMWDIYGTLGISATREFLKTEFFKMLDKLSNRHLDILVSSMTTSGRIIPATRYGMSRNQSSIFAKVAFEQPFDHFFNAASIGEEDNIQGVSAAIMVGKIGRMGTGMIDILPKPIEHKIEETMGEDNIEEEQIQESFDPKLEEGIEWDMI